eukprot:scaffold360_cov374-Pavlova_lutheri.AAC.43
MLDWRKGTIEDLMERQTSNVSCAMSVILRSCGSYVQEWFWGRKGHLLPSNVCGPTWSRSSLGSSRPTCWSPHALPLVHGLGRDTTHHEVVDRLGWDRRCRHWWMNLNLAVWILPARGPEKGIAPGPDGVKLTAPIGRIDVPDRGSQIPLPSRLDSPIGPLPPGRSYRLRTESLRSFVEGSAPAIRPRKTASRALPPFFSRETAPPPARRCFFFGGNGIDGVPFAGHVSHPGAGPLLPSDGGGDVATCVGAGLGTQGASAGVLRRRVRSFGERRVLRACSDGGHGMPAIPGGGQRKSSTQQEKCVLEGWIRVPVLRVAKTAHHRSCGARFQGRRIHMGQPGHRVRPLQREKREQNAAQERDAAEEDAQGTLRKHPALANAAEGNHGKHAPGMGGLHIVKRRRNKKAEC